MSSSPNLQFYRRRAKELLQALHSGDSAAGDRFAAHHPEFKDRGPDAVALHDAQLVVAREAGFSSWPRLKTYVTLMTESAPRTPAEHLEAIVSADELEQLEAFLEQHADAIGWRLGPLGLTPLHLAAQRGWLEGASRLLDAGADINGVTLEAGMTPLRAAIGWEQPTLAEFLLDRGADPRTGESDDRTTLGWAANAGYHSLVRKLLDRGVPMDIFAAIALNDAAAVRTLVEQDSGVLNRRLRSYQVVTMTPLHFAAQSNSAAMIDLLLTLGANRDQPDEQGRTPIDLVLHGGKRAAYERLRAHGATPNPELLALVGDIERAERIARLHQAILDGDIDRVTRELDADGTLVNQHFPDVWGSGGTFGAAPLHWAAMSGHLQIARLLLTRGADLTLCDLTHGGTPSGWAQQYQRREMHAFLEAQGNHRK